MHLRRWLSGEDRFNNNKFYMQQGWGMERRQIGHALKIEHVNLAKIGAMHSILIITLLEVCERPEQGQGRCIRMVYSEWRMILLHNLEKIFCLAKRKLKGDVRGDENMTDLKRVDRGKL